LKAIYGKKHEEKVTQGEETGNVLTQKSDNKQQSQLQKQEKDQSSLLNGKNEVDSGKHKQSPKH